MTLARRLLLAIGAVTLATTLLVGLGVRQAWRNAEGERFAEAFRAALKPLGEELAREAGELEGLVAPLCRRDELVDSALVGVLSHDLGNRRLSLSLRVPELAKALKRNAVARRVFDGLSYSHRKEYARHVAEAKKPETRARRVERTIEMLVATESGREP